MLNLLELRYSINEISDKRDLIVAIAPARVLSVSPYTNTMSGQILSSAVEISSIAFPKKWA